MSIGAASRPLRIVGGYADGAAHGSRHSRRSIRWRSCRTPRCSIPIVRWSIRCRRRGRIGTAGGEAVVSLVKLDGSQRPVGTIFADTTSRAIFLGTMELGDETRAMRYGHDANRDMAGLIERIGAQRWRVVLPYPRFESLLDVVELVPAT